MSRVAIAIDPLQVQKQRRAFARLLTSRLQLSAAFCRHQGLDLISVSASSRAITVAVLRVAEIIGSVATILGAGFATLGWFAATSDDPYADVGMMALIPGLIIAIVGAVLWLSAYLVRRVAFGRPAP